MNAEKPVGIDLGTTNSAMAWVDEFGRSQMIRNAEGELLTPSIVLFGAAEVVVGKIARSAVTTDPDLVAQWVKREMGAPFYSHPIHGEYLPPEVIQACILRKLKTDLVAAVGSEARTVITVPAYFDELRRKATADAGEMAGLKVVDIVNEPTAAALGFGEQLGYLASHGMPREAITVMVYDLGGGTFDVTLLKLAANNVKTLATDGDVQLGGHDWDKRLVDYAAEAFRKSYSVDPREEPAALNRMYQVVMEAKHSLSARSRSAIRVEHRGCSLDVPIAREQFEEMTADLLERTAYTSRQLLAAAKLQWKDVNRVLLVGGSTRMPMVPAMLEKLTGIQPDRTVNPDEAVARGAALYSHHLLMKQGGGAGVAFKVTNVNSHSLGIEGIEQETLRKTNVILIPRNTALPAKRTERFVTKSEGQKSIVVKILEGESSMPGECTTIGKTVVRDLPLGLPKGWPVEVTFEYASNGRLSVRAVVPGTHHEAQLDLEREAGLSDAGMARWKAPIAAAAGFGVFGAIAHDAAGGSQPLSVPQPFGPAPQQFSPAPQQFGPAPQQFGPAPQQFGPTPQQYSPAPQPFGHAPQTISPAPLASSPFSGLPMPGAPLGPAPTIEAPPSGSPLFGPMLPLGPMPTIAPGPPVEGLAPLGTNLQGGMPMGGLPPLAAPVGGLAGEIVPLVATPGDFVIMSGMPGENMPPGGPAASMPFGGMHPANVPLQPIEGVPHGSLAASDAWASPMPLAPSPPLPPPPPGPDPLGAALMGGMPMDNSYAAGPMPAASQTDPAPASYSIRRGEPKKLFASPLAKLAGHVVAALLGLACGYGLLHMIRPGQFRLPW